MSGWVSYCPVAVSGGVLSWLVFCRHGGFRAALNRMAGMEFMPERRAVQKLGFAAGIPAAFAALAFWERVAPCASWALLVLAASGALVCAATDANRPRGLLAGLWHGASFGVLLMTGGVVFVAWLAYLFVVVFVGKTGSGRHNENRKGGRLP